MTLEGVMHLDIIAYVGKDRQDALRAGAATEETFDDGLVLITHGYFRFCCRHCS